MQVAELGEFLERVAAAEEQRRAAEADGAVECAGGEVIVPEQDQAQVTGLGDRLTKRLRHAQRVGPAAELGLLHPLEGRLVGRDPAARGNETVTGGEDLQVQLDACLASLGDAAHQADVLLATVDFVGAGELRLERGLAGADVVAALLEVFELELLRVGDDFLARAGGDDQDLQDSSSLSLRMFISKPRLA